ncbi:glycosyltransferase [Streptomyces brevispora]|uniref:Glycosyltransferase n=1 Tax=Streptomyces brevispora TaxID=887462 RepID=A0ABZ1G4V1_9ACTN|nr:glycosyltransferase [Streptomyces brevispora]WSC14526.1 glycosyltransferase [Streptomyces brevispora]
MNPAPGPLVLIEPYAHRGGGHHQRTLAALASVRPDSLVIAPGGLSEDLGPLVRSSTRVTVGPVGPAAKILLAAARASARVSAAGRQVLASRRWPPTVRRFPHQVTLLARCLAEAACLRTARHLAPGAATVVILTASEALHGAAALLGGTPHLRFVHEVVTTEDLPVRWLGRIARRGEKRVIALYPTTAVRDQVAPAFPRLRGEVRAFAVDDGRRLTDAEREGARAAFTIPADAKAVCVVGGWWPYKDIATIDAALARLTEPLHVLVCGAPLDDSTLTRWHQLPNVRLHTVPGPVADQVLRLVYAAADAALVARKPGVGKESGLVMDAARLALPLIVSAHDPGLVARLTGEPWARLFPAGDPNALAKALDNLAAEAPVRPSPSAPEALDMHAAADQAAFLTDAYTRLTKECR